MLLDGEATRAKMVEGIREHVGGSQPGDSIVITYSGHGTFVPDTSGDEPDGRDEGLCPYDIGQGQVLLDDDIHGLFAGARRGRPGGADFRQLPFRIVDSLGSAGSGQPGSQAPVPAAFRLAAPGPAAPQRKR